MIECGQKLTGYGSFAYAQSLSEFGSLIPLERSGGWLLKRTIPGTSCFDAMGSYPLFLCEDWSALAADLKALPDDIASVSLVADPFGYYDRYALEACFDVVNPFKCHFLVDLNLPKDDWGTRSHRKRARRALKDIRVELCREPASFVDEWSCLYHTLRSKYSIKGVRGFSKQAFQRQLSMPGVVVLQAFRENQLIGAQIYFKEGDVIHCHLGAVSDEGYACGAFYAMDYYSFEFFSGQATFLDLGGGAGLSGGKDDGLSYYKRGWSSVTRDVLFCGRIVNHAQYNQLSADCVSDSAYFPTYRMGEFS